MREDCGKISKYAWLDSPLNTVKQSVTYSYKIHMYKKYGKGGVIVLATRII